MVPRGEAFLRPRFERALASAGHTHSWPDVVERIRSQQAQWWHSPDERGAIITEILTYPNCKVVNYWLGAGDLRSCLSIAPRIEEWARGLGCTRATGIARAGWMRLLGPDVHPVGVVYRKDL